MKNVFAVVGIGVIGFAFGEKVQSIRQQKRLDKVVPMLTKSIGHVISTGINESMNEEEVRDLLTSELEFFNIAFKLV